MPSLLMTVRGIQVALELKYNQTMLKEATWFGTRVDHSSYF